MKHITLQDVLSNFRQSTIIAGLLVASILGAYLLAEPTVGRAVWDQVVVTQGVTAEISFITNAANVALASIPGVTGGTSNGSTQVRVLTNNATGYSMTIAATSSPAMQGDTTAGEIQNYTNAVANIPDYSHSVGANTGEFAYTVSASTTGDLAQKFLDNASNACNINGGSDTSGSATCWYGITTTATSTVNRTTATLASGATTTIFFRTQITASPAPAIPEDTYTATTTLTATVN